jgi:hypothetical protein
VPPNLQRFLPIILLVFLVLFVLPAIFKKSSSKGTPTKTLSTETIAAMNTVDRAEEAFRAGHGRYSPHVADLLATNRPLAHDLSDGVVVQLDVSTDGQTYYGQVASTVIALSRARTGGRVIAHSCTEIKNSKDVTCPGSAAKTTSTSTSTSTSTP